MPRHPESIGCRVEQNAERFTITVFDGHYVDAVDAVEYIDVVTSTWFNMVADFSGWTYFGNERAEWE